MKTISQIKIILDDNIICSFKTERVSLLNSFNRVLAKDIISDINMPNFSKSAMDGYACISNDVFSNQLKVIDTVYAGRPPKKEIKHRECSRIMTGAMIPKGADCVVILEDVKKNLDDRISVLSDKIQLYNLNNKFAYKNLNIINEGNDFRKGDLILTKGTLLKSQHIALLASIGYDNVDVNVQPIVGVLSTGSELVEPGNMLEPTKIYNSNGYNILADILTVNVKFKYYGIVSDDRKKTLHIIKKAMKETDILIISGGVSIGDKDVVIDCMDECNMNIIFRKVAMKPGKYFTFARCNDFVCFGLPGNPVATFVLFNFFIKSYLIKMMSCCENILDNEFFLEIGEDMSFVNVDRDLIIPIYIKDGQVFCTKYYGSSHIHAYRDTKYVALIPTGTTKLEKGTKIYVRHI